MRKHGFSDFPDPLTKYGPGFTLGRGEYFPAIGNGTEVQSPAFRRAAGACGYSFPRGRHRSHPTSQQERREVDGWAVGCTHVRRDPLVG